MADAQKNNKTYGLTYPKKNALSVPKSTNVFGNEDESDDEDGTDWVKKALKAEGEKNRVKKQTRLNIQRALEEDPTICQYDEVFDDMKRNEEQGKTKKKEVKKAKYIQDLLKTAERRKREQEHRIERMVQKEREAEGAMFADKESFVTSAYRAKLEEFKKMEQEEERMERLESIGDVTKQQDMSGFYRHFFHQTVDGEKSLKAEKKSDAEGDEKSTNDADRDDPGESTSAETSDNDDGSKKSRASPTISRKKRSRQYRRRAVEESESESEHEEREVKRDASDAISEENTSESKSAEEKTSEPEKKRIKQSDDDKNVKKESDKIIQEKLASDAKTSEIDENSADRESKEDSKKSQVKEDDKKPKVSIWEKRTVGPIFEAALQRYFIRKNMRLSGS